MDSQLICAQKHDGVSPVFGVFATLKEVLAICTIYPYSTHRTLGKKTLRQHVLIRNDDWPWLVTTHSDQPHVARLCVQVQLDLFLGLLAGSLFRFVLGYATG